MIKRIIASALLVCLFIAIPLYLMGYTKVDLGVPFMALLKATNRDLADFKISIPDIPKIPPMSNVNGLLVVLDVLRKFFNGFINILNFVVSILNVAIQVVEFIALIVKNLITFKDSVQPYVDDFPYIQAIA